MNKETKKFYLWVFSVICKCFKKPKLWHFVATLSGFAGTLYLANSVVHAVGLFSSNGPIAGIRDEYYAKGIILISFSYLIEIILFILEINLIRKFLTHFGKAIFNVAINIKKLIGLKISEFEDNIETLVITLSKIYKKILLKSKPWELILMIFSILVLFLQFFKY